MFLFVCGGWCYVVCFYFYGVRGSDVVGVGESICVVFDWVFCIVCVLWC